MLSACIWRNPTRRWVYLFAFRTLYSIVYCPSTLQKSSTPASLSHEMALLDKENMLYYIIEYCIMKCRTPGLGTCKVSTVPNVGPGLCSNGERTWQMSSESFETKTHVVQRDYSTTIHLCTTKIHSEPYLHCIRLYQHR